MNWVLWRQETNIKEETVGTKLLRRLHTDGISQQCYNSKPDGKKKNKKWILTMTSGSKRTQNSPVQHQ